MSDPLVVSGDYNGTSITIYGEIHDNINQSFYESLNLSGKNIWVEHSTVLCDLLPEQEFLFENAKGLEWIWFTQTKTEQPVECIDVRIEIGLLSRIEELTLLRELGSVETHEMMSNAIISLITSFQRMMTIFRDEDPTWELIDVLEPFASRMNALAKSILVRFSEPHDPEKLMDDCMLLYNDMVFFSSTLLDSIIISMLKSYTDSTPIHLFVGLNHAIRLQHFLDLRVQGADIDTDHKRRVLSKLTGGKTRRK
jgi:hypothetical protein